MYKRKGKKNEISKIDLELCNNLYYTKYSIINQKIKCIYVRYVLTDKLCHNSKQNNTVLRIIAHRGQIDVISSLCTVEFSRFGVVGILSALVTSKCHHIHTK